MTRTQKQRLRRGVLYAAFGLLLLAIVILADWAKLRRAFGNWTVATDMFPEVITVGAKNTIVYTITAFVFSLTLALTLALMKRSTIKPYRWLAIGYIELFRGLPALITIILVGFGLPIALGTTVPGGFLGQATIGLGLVYAAYAAETIRAGIEAVPRGQMEAARSLGMSPGKATAYIILPQAFRIIIPPLTNELVTLIKDTSLLFVLGFTPESKELTKFGRDAMSDFFNGTPLTVVALVYLVITLPLTRLVAQMEKRAARAR
jgi:polar amino acid transport system permease protein